ncbi:hypothetical protein DSECCO2_94030 [anaerobic digester metagenome]
MSHPGMRSIGSATPGNAIDRSPEIGGDLRFFVGISGRINREKSRRVDRGNIAVGGWGQGRGACPPSPSAPPLWRYPMEIRVLGFAMFQRTAGVNRHNPLWFLAARLSTWPREVRSCAPRPRTFGARTPAPTLRCSCSVPSERRTLRPIAPHGLPTSLPQLRI